MTAWFLVPDNHQPGQTPNPKEALVSAWIVSKAHIDALTQSLAVAGIIGWADTTEVGHLLWRENFLSIEARYGDDPNTMPEYRFEGVEAPLDPRIMLKQVGCYEYQTCEHDGWPESRAHELMGRLYTHLTDTIGLEPDDNTTYYDLSWYQDAPWGIRDIHEAILHSERTTP